MERMNELEEENEYMKERMGQWEQELKSRDQDSRLEIADLEGKMIDIKNIV